MATIQDLIANAEDGFPASEGTFVDSTTSTFTTFTTEANDPTEIGEWGGPLGYTGWLKLVVPSNGTLVTISIVDTTDITDTVLWLYDEVPTASSVNIAQDDDGQSSPHGLWSLISEITLAAGTYYLCVTPFDGADWDTGEGGDVTVRVRWETEPVIATFSIDSVLKKVVEPPYYIDTAVPTFVAASTASVNNSSTITINVPVGVLSGDLLLAFISARHLTGSQMFATNVPFLIDTSGNSIRHWNQLSPGFASVSAGGGQAHGLWCFYRWADDPNEQVTFEHRIGGLTGSLVSNAKAAGMLAFRNAYLPIHRASSVLSTIDTSAKLTTQWFVQTTDPNYLATILQIGAWAGGRTGGTTTWTANSPVTERLDVSAANTANLMVGTWTDTLDTFIPSVSATPSAAEFRLTLTVHLQNRTTAFGLYAWKQPGDQFSLDAFIQAPTHTTHARTGPHYDTTPDTAILSSLLLGSLPAGTDLHTVLTDLDSRLTDLENQT